MERTRREWDKQVTRMDAQRLVKISKDNIPAGRSPGCPKRRWSDLILIKTGGITYNKEEEEEVSRSKSNQRAMGQKNMQNIFD